METRTRYGWQVIVGYLALIAFVLWVGLRNAVTPRDTEAHVTTHSEAPPKYRAIIPAPDMTPKRKVSGL